MTADAAVGAIIATVAGGTVTQIARSPLEFFIAPDDPDAPAALPPAACPDQNNHPGDGAAEDDDHPGGDLDNPDHPGGGGEDEDDGDHPAALDCYTTT
jgi:hypothetical protein